MRLNLAVTTMALILSTSVGFAVASTIILTDTSEQLYRYDDQGNPYFSESGVSGEEATLHVGKGSEMPLGLIAELVVPEGWHIDIPTQKLANVLVTISGGKSWSHSLRELAEKEKIYTNVSWDSKKVSFNASDEAKAGFGRRQTTLLEKGSLTENSVGALGITTANVIPNTKFSHKPNRDQRTADALQASNNTSVLNYADEVAAKKAERDQKSREMQMKQGLLTSTSIAARDSVAATEIKLGEVNEKNMFAKNENARLQRELEAAGIIIAKMNDRLSVVGQGNTAPVAEDLFAKYKDAWVLPFNATFDYYIKGGYLDNIEYRTPATYIAHSDTLENVIRAWANTLGMAVDWNTPVKHKVPHKLDFKGDIREAAVELFTLYAKSDRPLNITFFPDIGESGVIVVEDLNNKKRNTPSLNWITK